MSIVVDASVLLAATSKLGPDADWAEHTLAKDVLVAPHVVLVEATHALRRLERLRRLSVEAANVARRQLMRIPLQLHPFPPFSERIWELRATITAYDAWYVALAELLDVPLATFDEKLARASGPKCRFLVP